MRFTVGGWWCPQNVEELRKIYIHVTKNTSSYKTMSDEVPKLEQLCTIVISNL
jgi:hypothetical protein